MKRTPLTRKTPLSRGKALIRSSEPARLEVKRPKLSKASRSKRAPTVAESAWMDAITAIGCIACLIDGHPGTPGAVHHLLQGGRRMGHLFTICLCDPGHHQNGQQLGKVSRHPWKTRFEAQYGPERALLELTEQLVAQGRAAA